MTGDTEITVRISGEGLDLFEMYRTLRPLMDALGKINDLLYGCPPDDCRMDCFQFGCGAEFPFKEPVYSGITHPPPPSPPPPPTLPPMLPPSPPQPTSPPPSRPPASPPPMICLDTCGTAGDVVCQDGGWGAMTAL